MKKKGWFLLSFIMQGIAISPVNELITKLGKITPLRTGILIAVSIVAITISLIASNKYFQANGLNPKLNPKIKKFVTKYPLIVSLIPMVVAMSIAVLVINLLK